MTHMNINVEGSGGAIQYNIGDKLPAGLSFDSLAWAQYLCSTYVLSDLTVLQLADILDQYYGRCYDRGRADGRLDVLEGQL